MKIYEVQGSFGIDSLKVVEKPEPAPGPGQVLLKMRVWSLNYRDLLVVKGVYNPKIALPFTPFSDGVGEVVAVGAGVSRIKKGERVAGAFMQTWIEGALTESKSKSSLGGGGPGLLAEYVVLNAEGVVPVPAHLSDEEAATLPCAGVTAWCALVSEGQLKAGDVVLVQGTGGVSLFALQFARLSGARVIGTSSSDDKLKRVRELGASDGINYKTNPDWDKVVRDLTGGTGVDHVVEVGGAGTMPKSLRAVRIGGRISLIGVLTGGGEFNPMPILMKKARVQGIYVGSRVMFEDMNRAITLHKMRPVLDKVFPFAEAAAALRHMESASHFGKVCVTKP
jgi:NADPH:quinone reductase-like Zn-dependent oxidoreductase